MDELARMAGLSTTRLGQIVQKRVKVYRDRAESLRRGPIAYVRQGVVEDLFIPLHASAALGEPQGEPVPSASPVQVPTKGAALTEFMASVENALRAGEIPTRAQACRLGRTFEDLVADAARLGEFSEAELPELAKIGQTFSRGGHAVRCFDCARRNEPFIR